LDTDTILSQFEEIENRIETLISRCKSLEATNLELTATIENLESALREKEAGENQAHEVKALVRSKIDKLLERLDGITESETS